MNLGLNLRHQSMSAIGYNEICRHLMGEMSLDEAVN